MQNIINKIGMLFFILISFFMTNTIANAEPGVGEIRWVAFNFAPRGWVQCNGQLLDISQNTALYSVLGITYGGDGRTTFGVPDLRGRSMVHRGQGPGLSYRFLGSKSGSENVTLDSLQIPNHNHRLAAQNTVGDSNLPNDRVVSNVGRLRLFDNQIDTDMAPDALTSVGGGQSHNNMSPYIGLNCIMSLYGLYPSRS